MPIVQIDPTASNYPIIDEAGLYGPGLQHEADTELAAYERETADTKLSRYPAYDLEGKRGPYAYFKFTITQPAKGKNFVDHWETIGPNTGSKEEQMLLDMGVISAKGESFDSDAVAPRKIAGLEIGAPRLSRDGRLFTGKVIKVIG